jgi:hypothetical protein
MSASTQPATNPLVAARMAIYDLLDSHGVRETVVQVLMWENKRKSAALFASGVSLFVLVHLLGVGMLTVIGTLAILQLLVYRTSEALQSNGLLISQDVDLKEAIVVTPDASTISASIEILGDVLRNVEESIKEISLTGDYAKLGAGVGLLVFLSALGRVVSLPILLVVCHIGAFTGPIVYSRNQEAVDAVVRNALEATEIFLEKNLQTKVKLS